MGSNVPPMIPTRPPATERAYPGAPEPAPSGPTPVGGAIDPRPAGRGPMDRLDRLPRAAGRGPASRRCGDPDRRRGVAGAVLLQRTDRSAVTRPRRNRPGNLRPAGERSTWSPVDKGTNRHASLSTRVRT